MGAPDGPDGPEGIGRKRRALPLFARVGALLVALYIRLVNATTRWQIEGQEHLDLMLAREGGVVFAIWHGRLLLMPGWSAGGRRRVAMVSASRDGDFTAGVCAHFGIGSVRGSSHHHGKRRNKGALRAYIGARQALLRENALLGIAPDGPRGPRMRAEPGAAQLAIETGSPVLPVSYSVRWGRFLKSWDRFLLPFPFGRGVLIWGQPLFPPAKGDEEGAARYLAGMEAALTTITNRADELCGHLPLPPDLPADQP